MNTELINADCLEAMKGIPAGTVDVVMADPPYGTTSCRWDSVIPLDVMWEAILRVIKPGGVAVLMAQTPFDKCLGVSNIAMLKYEWIWEKTSATGHFNAKKMPMKAHENILVFCDRTPTYNPQMTHGHARKTTLRRKELNSECYGKNTRDSAYDSTSRYPRDVQVFSSDKQRGAVHPTQKPLALMEYLIHTHTNPGETVLDFCMGSGTTGVAAKNLGRDFIGIEIDRDYFEIAQGRISS